MQEMVVAALRSPLLGRNGGSSRAPGPAPGVLRNRRADSGSPASVRRTTAGSRSRPVGAQMPPTSRPGWPGNLPRRSATGRPSTSRTCAGGLALAPDTALAVRQARTNETNPARPVRARAAAQVGKGGQHIAVHDAVVLPVQAMAAQHLVGIAQVRRRVLQAGVVELVPAYRRCRVARSTGPGRVDRRLQLDIAAPDRTRHASPHRPAMRPPCRSCARSSAGCGPGTSGHRIRHRPACRRRSPGGCPCAAPTLSCSGDMNISGNPPPMNKPSTGGRLAILQRVERHDLGAGLFQRLEVVRVIEAEGLVAGQADPHPRRRSRPRWHAPDVAAAEPARQRRAALRATRSSACRSTCAAMRSPIGRTRCAASSSSLLRHQPQMALDQRQHRVVRHRAQHGHIGVVLDHRAQLGFVARAAELVQDHAGNPDARVEGLVPQDQRCDAACHAARVEHQHHRQVEQMGQRGVAVAAVQRQAVVQALVALDDADVRSGAMAARNSR